MKSLGDMSQGTYSWKPPHLHPDDDPKKTSLHSPDDYKHPGPHERHITGLVWILDGSLLNVQRVLTSTTREVDEKHGDRIGTRLQKNSASLQLTTPQLCNAKKRGTTSAYQNHESCRSTVTST